MSQIKRRIATVVAVIFILSLALGASGGSRLGLSCATNTGTTTEITVEVVDESRNKLECRSFSGVSTMMNQMVFSYAGGEITGLECDIGTFVSGPEYNGETATATWMFSTGTSGNEGALFTITVASEGEPAEPSVSPKSEDGEPAVTRMTVSYSDAFSLLHSAGVRVSDDVEITGGRIEAGGVTAELDVGKSALSCEIPGNIDSSSIIVIVLFYNTGSAEMSARLTDGFSIDAEGGSLTIDTGVQTVVLDVEGYGFRILDAGDAVGSLPSPEGDGRDFLGWQDGDGNLVTAESRIYKDTKLKPVFASVTEFAGHKVYIMNEANELIAGLEEKYGRVDMSSVRMRLLGDGKSSNENYFSNGWSDGFSRYLICNCTAQSDGVEERANVHIEPGEITGVTIFADTYSGHVRHTIYREDLRVESYGDTAYVYLDNDPYLELDTRGRFAYMQGRTDGLFSPDDGITRAEAASIIYRCLTDSSRSSLTEAGYFTDVSPAAWYGEAVMKLSGAGLLGGYEDGGFHPDAPITRGEFSAIAVRLLGESELGVTGLFTDTAGNWAEGYINRASRLGLVSGYEDGSFRPGNGITRAEAATLMNALLERDTSSFGWSLTEWEDVQPEDWYYLDVLAATTGPVRE